MILINIICGFGQDMPKKVIICVIGKQILVLLVLKTYLCLRILIGYYVSLQSVSKTIVFWCKIPMQHPLRRWIWITTWNSSQALIDKSHFNARAVIIYMISNCHLYRCIKQLDNNDQKQNIQCSKMTVFWLRSNEALTIQLSHT